MVSFNSDYFYFFQKKVKNKIRLITYNINKIFIKSKYSHNNMSEKKPVHKTHKESKHLFGLKDEEFSKENMIEGVIIRPGVLMISFFTFILAMFLMLAGNYKWGGSMIVFSFVVNLYSIYESLTDEPSIFKKLNLAFKFTLFLFEIIAFNWLLLAII